MSCCFSREDPIGCCGLNCPHDEEARHSAQEMLHEMSEARRLVMEDAESASSEELGAASQILDKLKKDR